MRTCFKIFAACFFAMTACTAALADQDLGRPGIRHPEQIREQIEHLYRLEQAFLVCDHVRVTGVDLTRLDDAIADAELTSGIAEAELETIYEQVEKSAGKHQDAFCSAMTDAVRNIRELAMVRQD